MSTTYTGFLLDDLQDPLGRKQEVHEAAETVSSVLPLHHTEELPQDRGSGGAEGSVHGRQSALDAVVQRLSVLRGETKRKKTPRWLNRKCFVRRPKFSSSCGHIKAKTGWNITGAHAASRPFIRQPFQECSDLRPGESNPHFTTNNKKKSNQQFFFFMSHITLMHWQSVT